MPDGTVNFGLRNQDSVGRIVEFRDARHMTLLSLFPEPSTRATPRGSPANRGRAGSVGGGRLDHGGVSKIHPVTSSPTKRINSSALLFWTTPGRKRKSKLILPLRIWSSKW
jgi:hypothetical protein